MKQSDAFDYKPEDYVDFWEILTFFEHMRGVELPEKLSHFFEGAHENLLQEYEKWNENKEI
jgi:hypothetical protein